MIQRLQTVYILIGTLLVLVTVCFCPHLRCDTSIDNMYVTHSTAGLAWLIIFFAYSVYTIFLFKNRKKQIYFLNGNLMGILGLILVLHVFEIFIMKSDLMLQYNHNWLFDIGLLIGAICFFLARKSVKNDEDLIKSINRLR